jgi:uncharacterized membrane protein
VKKIKGPLVSEKKEQEDRKKERTKEIKKERKINGGIKEETETKLK